MNWAILHSLSYVAILAPSDIAQQCTVPAEIGSIFNGERGECVQDNGRETSALAWSIALRTWTVQVQKEVRIWRCDPLSSYL